MSRRPKLLVGNLYHIKMNDSYCEEIHPVSPYTSEHIFVEKTFEYIAEILKIEEVDNSRLCIILSILASTQDQGTAVSELKRASTGYLQADGTYQRPITIQYMGPFNDGGEYLWERAAFCQMKGRGPVWMKDAVIKKFNPKNLPIYITWPFGSDWAALQLKQKE